jgi:hypothetical protein
MLRKLGRYPRQNSLAVALRELGRIERTLFILSGLQSVELRRRVHAGLNKGEARNALARAVFLCRLGEIRDRSFEQQRYRASGLTLSQTLSRSGIPCTSKGRSKPPLGTGRHSTLSCSSISPRSAGSTSTSPATINGRAAGSPKADSGLSEPQTILDVVYCPFSEGTPLCFPMPR